MNAPTSPGDSTQLVELTTVERSNIFWDCLATDDSIKVPIIRLARVTVQSDDDNF
jgi:hypothetical protein